MANYTTLDSLFTAIADKIRAKKGTTDSISADDFPTEIEKMPGADNAMKVLLNEDCYIRPTVIVSLVEEED